MAHVPNLLTHVGALVDLHVIILRAAASPTLHNVRSVTVIPDGGVFRRALHLSRAVLRLQQQGCTRFFVRISTFAALVIGAIARARGMRLYLWQSGQSHNLIPSWRNPGRRIRLECAFAIQKLSMRLAHRLVTGPERMVTHYEERFGVSRDRIALLYNDVDTHGFGSSDPDYDRAAFRETLGVGTGDAMVLYVGRISPLKGGHRLLPLAAELQTIIPNARLVVVGADTHGINFTHNVREARLGNVIQTGAVPNKHLSAYYKAADVFVLPSESEGFPRVLLEALAHGSPAVAFDVGGVKDIVPREFHDLVVAPGDVSAMVAAIYRVVTSPDLSRKFAAAARRHIERYSTPSVAAMLVAVVCESGEGDGPPA